MHFSSVINPLICFKLLSLFLLSGQKMQQQLRWPLVLWQTGSRRDQLGVPEGNLPFRIQLNQTTVGLYDYVYIKPAKFNSSSSSSNKMPFAVLSVICQLFFFFTKLLFPHTNHNTKVMFSHLHSGAHFWKSCFSLDTEKNIYLQMFMYISVDMI